MRLTRHSGPAVLLAAALSAGPAFAMDTDDPGTVAPKAAEFEISAEYATSPGVKETAAGVAVTTGILDNLDVGLAVPFVMTDPDEGDGESGLGDLEVGLKYRFLEAEGARPALALTVGVTIPTGDDEKGLGSGKVNYGAAVVAGFGLQPVNVFLNLGYGRANEADEEAGEKKDGFQASAAVEWAVSDPLALNAEILVESARADGEDAPLAATAGAAWVFSDTLCLDGGVRVGLSDTAPDWGVFATLTIAADFK